MTFCEGVTSKFARKCSQKLNADKVTDHGPCVQSDVPLIKQGVLRPRCRTAASQGGPLIDTPTVDEVPSVAMCYMRTYSNLHAEFA